MTFSTAPAKSHWVKKNKDSDLFSKFDAQALTGLWEPVQGEKQASVVECKTRKDKQERKNAKTAGLLTYLWPCRVILRTQEAFRSESKAQVTWKLNFHSCPRVRQHVLITKSFLYLCTLGYGGTTKCHRSDEPSRTETYGVFALWWYVVSTTCKCKKARIITEKKCTASAKNSWNLLYTFACCV